MLRPPPGHPARARSRGHPRALTTEAIRPALAAALLVLTALVAASPAHAQDADGNVFHDGDSLPWGEPNDGVRFLPLYGDMSADGEVFAFRLEVQPGFELGPHTHPVTST